MLSRPPVGRGVRASVGLLLCVSAQLVALRDAAAQDGVQNALWSAYEPSAATDILQQSHFQPLQPFQPPATGGPMQPEVAQQPALLTTPRTPRATSTTWRSSTFSRRPVTRLASIPKMFGDYGPTGACEMSVYDMNKPGNRAFVTDLASAGVGQRLKVMENNNAWPDDRVDFYYRHYQNSLRSTPRLSSPNVNQFPSDTYTFSYERTFLQGNTSVQFILPFLGTPTLRSSDPAFPTNFVSGGNMGNFGMIFKGLLINTGSFALCGGTGLNLPTGSDASGQAFNTAFHIRNRSFQLSPFTAFIWAPDAGLLSNFYLMGASQYDMVGYGNTVQAVNSLSGFNGPLLQIVDTNLLFNDLVLGAWLYEAPGARLLRGMVGQVELHHTMSGTPHFASAMAGSNRFVFGGAQSRIDNLNITGGLRLMLPGNMVLSVGAVAPLHRPLFDAEVQAVSSIFL